MFAREAKEGGTDVDTVMAKRTKNIPLGKLVQPEDLAAVQRSFARMQLEW